MNNGSTTIKWHGLEGHDQHTKVCRLNSVVHCAYCTQTKSHWATRVATQAVLLRRMWQWDQLKQSAPVWIPTVRVKEDKPCYAPVPHGDITACVCACVWERCVSPTGRSIKSHCTAQCPDITLSRSCSHFPSSHLQDSQSVCHEK